MQTKLKDTVKVIRSNLDILTAFLIFLIIRQILISKLPIYAISTAAYDDKLMVDLALSLKNGDWLGAYSNTTFVKGIGFPLFLAVNNALNIDYLTASNLFYSFSCLYFVLAIKPICKHKWSHLFILIILLLNPVSYALKTLQRVYRNGITMGQVLLITGSLFGFYFRTTERLWKLWLQAVIGGIALAWLWNTREDGFWMLPFLFVAIILTILKITKNHTQLNIKERATRILITFIPCFLLVLSIVSISSINQYYYGTFLTTEVSSGNFPEARKALYKIDPGKSEAEENNTRLSIPYSTVELAYSASPTLNSIRTEFDTALKTWGQYADSHPGDGETENGWFFWALRMAANNAGKYTDSVTSEAFFSSIAEELNAAFESGILSERTTMPSALMAPWKSYFLKPYIQSCFRSIQFISTFEDVSAEEIISPNETGYVATFEELTGNQAIISIDEITQSNISIKTLNMITSVYRFLGPILGITALAAYLLLLFQWIKDRKNLFLQNLLLCLTGLAASLVVLVLGVAYSDVTSFPSINYMYLSGAYPLYLSFITIASSYLFDSIQSFVTLKIK